MEHLAEPLASIPGVVAVTLGGSRATGRARPDSDWDFGLYYRGDLDVMALAGLGWHGRVFAPGDWGPLVNGGAWLEVDGARVDLVYRDLDVVEHWTREAEAGRFEIQREVGYVAGLATYVLMGELALGRVLAGTLPRPGFPEALRASAPPVWFTLAAGALVIAGDHAARDDATGCLANLGQGVLATAQGRLAARSEWALNEKGIVERAGLAHLSHRLLRPADGLRALVAGIVSDLALPETVWSAR
ncbi:MAG TPA: nucleotidyltransferase domain-containing protein [Acidimicrobiales bacterium]|nr:nucleotidyltransferase domain-containing protein [Acidimicrobiales bacterium]